MSELTHFNQAGEAHMVDIADKDQTHRIGIAEGWISMHPETFALVEKGNAKKGDVLAVARIAAIMGSKKTPDLIPLCHPIALTHVNVDFELYPEESKVRCVATCETKGRTGVEMEALTAVQVGLLTIYDMLKAVDRGMCMTDIRLLEKHGGKSGDFYRKVSFSVRGSLLYNAIAQKRDDVYEASAGGRILYGGCWQTAFLEVGNREGL